MKNIRILLDRYWEGETTLEEERELKAYFNSGPIAEEFRKEAPFFQALQQEKQVQYVRKATRIPLPVHWSVRTYASVAAAMLLLLLTAWWTFRPPATPAMDMVQQALPKQTPEQERTPQMVEIQVNKAPQMPTTHAVQRVKKSKKRSIKPSPTSPETDVVVLQPTTALDPETRQALAEVRAALALVSSKLSKGKKTAARQINHVETLDKFIKKKGDI
jgi:hypothetical protein